MINYESTCNNKCETTRAKKHNKAKRFTIKVSRPTLQKGKQKNGGRRPAQRTSQEAVGKDRCRRSQNNKQPISSRQRKKQYGWKTQNQSSPERKAQK